MDLGTLIPRHARFRPEHTAVVFGDDRLSYADFNKRVNRLANGLLAAGIGKNDKVATVLPNCLELLDLYWAAARTGAVVVPMSPLLQPSGLTNLLRDSDSAMIVTHPNYVPLIDACRGGVPIAPDNYIIVGGAPRDGYRAYDDLLGDETDPPAANLTDDDVYNIIYSSGTTGEPKGIVHSHYVRANYATHFGQNLRITPESVVLHTGAAIFNGAFVTLMPIFYNGGTFILHKSFDVAKAIQTIRDEGVTHVIFVPAQIIQLINHLDLDAGALDTLEAVICMGAPLHLEYKKRFDALLPGCFHELYGLTEGFMTILDKTDFARKPESVGCCPPFQEMRICDEAGNDLPAGEVGEIVGRGPHLMPGYYKRPDLTAQTVRDGWLYTGDLGYVDEDGFLYLVDRKKDMIISGGVKVYPRDIEDIAVAHPDVAEIAVFGVPDEKWGETPVAAAILKKGATTGADELRDWINANVGAKFQRVSRVVIKDEFPRNAAGKTLKRALRDEQAGG